MSDKPFHDAQTRKPWWVWPLIAFLAAAAWLTFILQIVLGRPVGPNPAPDLAVWIIFIAVGLFVPTMVMLLRIDYHVDDREIRCRYRPIWRKHIPIDAVQSAEPRTYRPMAEYLGWGIRWFPGRGWVYSLSGNKGVQLVLKGGRRLLLGTDHPEALAQAINERRRVAS